jgi:hypothetical protein
MSTDTQSSVLRARIGVEYPSELARDELEDRLVEAITTAIAQAGGRLEVLQLDLAARPDWDQFGPIDRVTGKALWGARLGRPPQIARPRRLTATRLAAGAAGPPYLGERTRCFNPSFTRLRDAADLAASPVSRWARGGRAMEHGRPIRRGDHANGYTNTCSL